MRHEEGPFAYVGGDSWPLTDDNGGSSVSGARCHCNAAGEMD